MLMAGSSSGSPQHSQQPRPLDRAPITSGLHLRTDIGSIGRHVSKVPQAVKNRSVQLYRSAKIFPHMHIIVSRGTVVVSVGPTAPATLLVTIAANGATAFLVIVAMTFGLILPRMLFERFLPAPT